MNIVAELGSFDTAHVLRERLAALPGSESLMRASMAWMSSYYDDEAGLLFSTDRQRERHMVRESLWYALGIVVRCLTAPEDESCELDRVPVIVERVLQAQLHSPGKIWHGTFKRAPEEPDPPAEAKIWIDYDPNWRQFIGTVLLLLLRLEGEGRLSHLANNIRHALIACVNGEPVERVPPAYTNIALMRAWLEIEMAGQLGNAYHKQGLDYARAIVDGFNVNQTFAEYNSPTYYGINFYALGLWQHYSTSSELRAMGGEVAGKLWRDVARYYHAGMKNLCGPWSRSYGMDMQDYVAALGLWIWAANGESTAAFPIKSFTSGMRLNHDHDFCLGPVAAMSATLPPSDVVADFIGFQGNREFFQVISTSPRRQAHALIARDVMIGLETSEISYRGADQYHPLTCHWSVQDRVHWFRLRFKGRLMGEIQGRVIDLVLIPDEAVDECVIETGPGGLQVEKGCWRADGLVIHVATELVVSPVDNGVTLRGIKGETRLALGLKLESEGT